MPKKSRVYETAIEFHASLSSSAAPLWLAMPRHRLLDVITPSLSVHAHHYAQQLDSWVRFCADVGGAVAFYVVVSKKDRRAFEVATDRFAKIAQVSVLLIENLVNATLQPPELRGILREHILLSNNPGTMTARRHSYQSAKKMLGCLGAAQSDAHPSGDRGATWCLLTDSETRLIRPTSAAAMLDAYQRRRTILYNGNWQPKGYWRCVTQNDQALLPNLPVNQSSWFLEAYAWFVERHVVAEFVRTAFPRIPQMACDKNMLFAEGTLYAFIALTPAHRARYTLVETSSYFGIHGLEAHVPKSMNYAGCSMGECIGGILMNMSDAQLAATASLWRDNGLPTYTPRGNSFDERRWAAFFEASGVSILSSPNFRGTDGGQARSILAFSDRKYPSHRGNGTANGQLQAEVPREDRKGRTVMSRVSV